MPMRASAAAPGSSSGAAPVAARANTGDSTAPATANYEALAQLLHAAIDGHKRYPQLARRQRREGIATVLFQLHPDGMLDRLELHASSGFAALDAAALRAVAAVGPFAPAAKFLTREARFRIGVQFHLN